MKMSVKKTHRKLHRVRTAVAHVDSRRWPSTSRTDRRGRACSGRSPPWSRAQRYGAAAGWGTVFRVAKLGQTGLLEGCHVGPTGRAAKRRGAADGSFMGHQFFKKLLFKYTGGFFSVCYLNFLLLSGFQRRGTTLHRLLHGSKSVRHFYN